METPDKQTDMSAMTRLEVADVVGKAVTLGFMDACDLTIGKDNQKTGREVAAALGITHARIGQIGRAHV